MEKIRTLLREEGIVSHPILFVTVVTLGLIFTDPFEIGPLGGLNFRPTKLALAPYKQVMMHWPRDNQSRLKLGRLEFVDQVFGPESLEFDRDGNGPYAGLADGRIVRWMGESLGWETFAFVSRNWTEKLCANGVDSATAKQHDYETQCGRPLGLRFNKHTGDLYIADAYFGLMVVGPNGGLASSLASHVGGLPILFANDLDIHKNGSVYFTDSSMRYNRQNHFFILLETEATGRLLRYDPDTKTTHVVLRDLTFPNGVQISKDHTFLLYTETTSCRVTRYWLEGPKAGQVELFANLPGFPDNVRMNDRGQFWVAIDCCRTPTQQILSTYPWLRSLYFRIPLKLKYLAKKTGMEMYTVASLFNENGEVIDVLEDRKGEVMKLVSEVREVNGKLWFGTVAYNHIPTYDYP